MTDNIESISARRADKSGDCRDWSVADALRESLRLVESGDIKPDMVYIAFSGAVPGDHRDHWYKCAGGSKLEMIGLLARHLHITNEYP